MKDEYLRQLAREFPDQFPDGQAYSINVGDGWYGLVREACVKLQHELIDNPKLRGRTSWFQIKEKFGGIRLNYDLRGLSGPMLSNSFLDAISEIERRSFKTCEDCGSCEAVTTEGPGWLRSLCPKCREEMWARRSRR